MKKLYFLFLIFAVGCAPFRKSILISPTTGSSHSVDRFYSTISKENGSFKGMVGSGRIVLQEGKDQWSAIFRSYVISRDSSKISIYGPLGMKVFTVFIYGNKISFDRKTDYEAISDLLQSADLTGEKFTSILSSIPLIDTQTVRIDSSKEFLLRYSDLNWFYSPNRDYPDSLYIKNNGKTETIVRYKIRRGPLNSYFVDIYSVVFGAHLKIFFDKVRPLI